MNKVYYLIHKRNLKKINAEGNIIYLDERINDNKDEYLLDYSKESGEKNKIRLCYNIDYVQRWAFTKYGGKSFAEELIYNGYSLWYPLEFFFISADIGQLSYELSVSGITYYLDLIINFINTKKPSKVIIEDDDNQINKLIIKVCIKHKIRYDILNIKSENKSILWKISNNSVVIRNYIKTRIILRKIIGRILCKKSEKSDIIILTSDRMTNWNNITDQYWGPIVRELDNNKLDYKIIEYDRIETLSSLINIRKRYFPSKFDAQFIGTYYEKSTNKEMWKIILFLREKFKKLVKEDYFKESFSYKGIDYYDVFYPKLKKIFLTYSYYIADVYSICKTIVEKENPKIILIDHEKNYYGRALITEANFQNIPGVGFEAEFIYDDNIYITQIPIKGIINRESKLWKPIPTLKLLNGEYSKEWHIKRNYMPSKNLKVIGLPKFDYLNELKHKKPTIRKEILITVITCDYALEEMYLRTILGTVNNLKNVKLIIKLHPTDSVLNTKKIKNLTKGYNVNAEVIQFTDTSLLISSSDMIISYASMIVYECILLDKPIVLFGKDDFSQPYVKEKLIKSNTNFKDLKKEILDTLKHKKRMDKNKRKKFIKKYLYSDDGKSSERAVEIIKEIMKKS